MTINYFKGSENDASIWQNCDFKEALDTGKLNLPKSDGDIKHHLLGDDIFGLTERLMKPYARNHDGMTVSQKIFNYRYAYSNSAFLNHRDRSR